MFVSVKCTGCLEWWVDGYWRKASDGMMDPGGGFWVWQNSYLELSMAPGKQIRRKGKREAEGKLASGKQLCVLASFSFSCPTLELLPFTNPNLIGI